MYYSAGIDLVHCDVCFDKGTDYGYVDGGSRDDKSVAASVAEILGPWKISRACVMVQLSWADTRGYICKYALESLTMQNPFCGRDIANEISQRSPTGHQPPLDSNLAERRNFHNKARDSGRTLSRDCVTCSN